MVSWKNHKRAFLKPPTPLSFISLSGTLLLLTILLLAALMSASRADAQVFLLKWGSFGIGDGQFQYPQGVAVDPSGNVYVADFGNNRIQKFTGSGAFITKWGSLGSGDGQFDEPVGVGVVPSGNVYVADRSNHRIQKGTLSSFVTRNGTQLMLDGQPYRFTGLNIYNP